MKFINFKLTEINNKNPCIIQSIGRTHYPKYEEKYSDLESVDLCFEPFSI